MLTDFGIRHAQVRFRPKTKTQIRGVRFKKPRRLTVTPYQGALISAVLVMGLGYQAMRAQAPKSESAANAQQIERGRYVVEIGGCNDCHTAGYAEAGGKAAEADRLKGDTLGFRGPWGTTYPTNLRLSIGNMTEDQWLKYGKSLMTRPPMPWFNVRAMTEADLRAVYQYVKSMPGGAGIAAPAYVPPDSQPKPPYIQWPGVK
jgi:mono/diheme cytochrome c family protein